jgi:transposase-like protein
MADELELSLGDLDARFTDPFAAADYLESIRWPDGPVCPHCGEAKRKPYRLKHQTRKLWKCAACRKQYTVTVGTIFEASHVPLHKWLLAFYLLCSSKKGMSAHQLHRMLGVTYKTGWFIFHRVREAMRDPAFTSRLVGTVEADETYIGGKRRTVPGKRHGRPGPKDKNKSAVLSLFERDGRARSFHIARVDAAHLKGAIRDHVERDASIMTDEWRSYAGLDREFASHETVSHGVGEYARGAVHTNTVEGYFATLKRGVNGTYHRISPAHLHRYLNEFDFRYSTRSESDSARTVRALSQTAGKRLMYRDSCQKRTKPL